MQGVRSIRIFAAAATAFAVLVTPPPASAAPDPYGHEAVVPLPSTQEGAHTVIHYSSRPEDGESAISDESAAQMLAGADAAIPAIGSQFGFPLIPDGDGKVDIYVWEWPINGGDAIAKSDDPDAPAASGYIKVDSSHVHFEERNAPDPAAALADTMAHELAHVFQGSLFQYKGRSRDAFMLHEGSAEAIAQRTGGPGDVSFVGTPPGTSLNDPEAKYASWLFFESLITDYGEPILADAFRELAAGHEPLGALESALAKRGSSLAAAHTAFAARYAAGDWRSPEAQGSVPEVAAANRFKLPRKPPKKPVDLKGAHLALNHLSYELVQYLPGKTAKRCDSGKLTVTAQVPPGAPPPVLVVRKDARDDPPFSRRTFALKGTEARTKLKWAACKNVATVVLANPSASADGQPFAVEAEYAPPKN
jgi:hypothetical protein